MFQSIAPAALPRGLLDAVQFGLRMRIEPGGLERLDAIRDSLRAQRLLAPGAADPRLLELRLPGPGGGEDAGLRMVLRVSVTPRRIEFTSASYIALNPLRMLRAELGEAACGPAGLDDGANVVGPTLARARPLLARQLALVELEVDRLVGGLREAMPPDADAYAGLRLRRAEFGLDLEAPEPVALVRSLARSAVPGAAYVARDAYRAGSGALGGGEAVRWWPAQVGPVLKAYAKRADLVRCEVGCARRRDVKRLHPGNVEVGLSGGDAAALLLDFGRAAEPWLGRLVELIMRLNPNRGEDIPWTRDRLRDLLATLDAPWSHATKRFWIAALTVKPELEPAEIAEFEYLLADQSGMPLKLVEQFRIDQQNRDEEGLVTSTTEKAAERYLALLRAENSELVSVGRDLYGYRATNGFYEKYDRDHLIKEIMEWLKGKPVLKGVGTAAQIADRTLLMVRQPDFFHGAPVGLNCADGFARWNSARGKVELVDHGPEHKARSRLGFAFGQDAQAPVFLAGLRRLCQDSEPLIASIQQVFGAASYGLFPHKDQARKVFILVGPGRSGKSTLISVLESFFAEHERATVTPTSWGGEYSRARLEYIRLNTCPELSKGRLPNADIFKQVAGCEVVAARFVKERERQFPCLAKHLFAGNEVPTTTDTSSAFARRIMIIRLPRPLETSEVDGEFLAKALQERAGIAQWAAEGAEHLMRNQAYALPPGHAEAMLDMQLSGDEVGKFAHEKIEAGTGPRLWTLDLQLALREYLEAKGAEFHDAAGAMRKLSAWMEQLYGASRKKSRGVPYYEGVRWRRTPGLETSPGLGGMEAGVSPAQEGSAAPEEGERALEEGVDAQADEGVDAQANEGVDAQADEAPDPSGLEDL